MYSVHTDMGRSHTMKEEKGVEGVRRELEGRRKEKLSTTKERDQRNTFRKKQKLKTEEGKENMW